MELIIFWNFYDCRGTIPLVYQNNTKFMGQINYSMFNKLHFSFSLTKEEVYFLCIPQSVTKYIDLLKLS